MKAVLWDFDGTLVDSEPVWIEVESAFVAGHGGVLTPEISHQMIGADPRFSAELIAGLLPGCPVSVEQIMDEVKRRVAKTMADRPLPFKPGAEHLLSQIRQAGLPCALISSSPRELLASAVAKMPAGSFDVVVSSDDVVAKKPDPEGYFRAMTELGVDPSDVVILEDSLPGTAAASASGAVVIAIPDIVPVPDAPRRVIVETLKGLTVEDLWMIWQEQTDAVHQ